MQEPGDDRTILWAFDPQMGFHLRPVFNSDFTHFDVPDFADVIPEAFEMVEKGFVDRAVTERLERLRRQRNRQALAAKLLSSWASSAAGCL